MFYFCVKTQQKEWDLDFCKKIFYNIFDNTKLGKSQVCYKNVKYDYHLFEKYIINLFENKKIKLNYERNFEKCNKIFYDIFEDIQFKEEVFFDCITEVNIKKS